MNLFRCKIMYLLPDHHYKKLFEIQKMIFTDVIYRKNHFNAL